MIANDHDKFLRLVARLRLEEGVKRFPYLDTKGKWTIGVGFNLSDVGLYPEEINFILANRLVKVEDELVQVWSEYRNLDEVRQSVMIDMAYNCGVPGLMNFHSMLGALLAKNYQGAADAMRHSLWYKEVGHRGEFLAAMMESGKDN